MTGRRLLLPRLIVGAGLLGLAGFGAFWLLTAPRGLSEAELAALPEGDPARGETLFWAGGCAS